MPEGPEIRLAADRLARVLVGRELQRVEFGLPRLQPFVPALEGRRVVDLHPRGKALLTRFDNGLTLYSHNQLYGRWMVRRRDRLPQTGRSLRVALHTASHSVLLYSASDIEVLDDDGLAVHPFLSRLGPDVLDETLAWRDLAARLQNERFAGRSLAALYLDQRFLAGVGNYLRSEILFEARLWPWARPAQLGRGEIGRLARASLAVSRQSYRTAGITNKATRVSRLRRAGLRRESYRFQVFGRQGEPCYLCGTAIRREQVGARRLYFCPACQAAVQSASSTTDT
jgi:endonuclease-8